MSPKEAVRHLLNIGPCLPSPSATSQELREHCIEMYNQLNLVREWAIDLLVGPADTPEEKENEQTES